MDDIEILARLICQADGLDPDKEVTGLGALAPLDTKYPFWQTRIKYAVAIVKAGWNHQERR
jgi:hypothetical protein